MRRTQKAKQLMDRAARSTTESVRQNASKLNRPLSPGAAGALGIAGVFLGGQWAAKTFQQQMGVRDAGFFEGGLSSIALGMRPPPGQSGMLSAEGQGTNMLMAAVVGIPAWAATMASMRKIPNPTTQGQGILPRFENPTNWRQRVSNRFAGAGDFGLNTGRNTRVVANVAAGAVAVGATMVAARAADRLAQRIVREGTASFHAPMRGTEPTRRTMQARPNTSRVAHFAGATAGPGGWGGDSVLQLHQTGGRGGVLR